AAPASRAPVAPRTGAAVAAAAAPTASAHVIYFEFDSATITPEGLVVVDQWAKFLGANPSAKVRLEGHADERGTREYNIGLGERRANSVQEALAARGVGPRQFAIVSFGEERPVALGHDEPAWRQNRRVEIAD
ncbi:MAG: peptidoglycan-associated lipoprotein Pal, partial [Gammaproteobacteria bacterium]|nr:peptidoglycan-associated lipoprotein Pal [Gammaproteobacteria bacterium]